MPDIKQDLLSLQYSQKFEIQGTQEANVDLELPPVPVSSATVYGTVTDGTSPIADATVNSLTVPVCPIATLSPTKTAPFPFPIFPQALTAWRQSRSDIVSAMRRGSLFRPATPSPLS